VTDLAASGEFYELTLGMTKGLHRKLPERGVEVQFFELPETRIELLAPLGDNSTVQSFLDKRGPGLHHICYSVVNIAFVLKTLVDQGMIALDPTPRPGAEDRLVAFLHPKSAGGVLMELQEL
jgi:methylmalonyl-CoA/ethylmalonyl-CoA epimerase